VILIRPAGPGDAATLAEMRYAFRAEAGAAVEPRPAFIERTTRWLGDRLGRGAWYAWIASAPEQPAGLVLVQLVEKVPNPVGEPETIGYLSSLYVHPRWRGHGTGGLLIATVVDFCRSREAESVVLWPSRRSIPLYERHGFRGRDGVMELRLSIRCPREGKPWPCTC
jgi:GNAT superfamily N-acetyltransferase